jgi:hypothetical protein
VLTRLSVRAQLPLADGRELDDLPVGAATVCAGQTAHHRHALVDEGRQSPKYLKSCALPKWAA